MADIARDWLRREYPIIPDEPRQAFVEGLGHGLLISVSVCLLALLAWCWVSPDHSDDRLHLTQAGRAAVAGGGAR